MATRSVFNPQCKGNLCQRLSLGVTVEFYWALMKPARCWTSVAVFEHILCLIVLFHIVVSHTCCDFLFKTLRNQRGSMALLLSISCPSWPEVTEISWMFCGALKLCVHMYIFNHFWSIFTSLRHWTWSSLSVLVGTMSLSWEFSSLWGTR